jgi:hypothetical protein
VLHSRCKKKYRNACFGVLVCRDPLARCRINVISVVPAICHASCRQYPWKSPLQVQGGRERDVDNKFPPCSSRRCHKDYSKNLLRRFYCTVLVQADVTGISTMVVRTYPGYVWRYPGASHSCWFGLPTVGGSCPIGTKEEHFSAPAARKSINQHLSAYGTRPSREGTLNPRKMLSNVWR